MKRIFWVTVVFFMVGIAAFAQTKTSAEVKQDSRTMLSQGQTAASQFDSTQADLNARNQSNKDSARYQKLRTDMQKLEAAINKEHTSIASILDSGRKVNASILERVQRLIEQHKSVLSELEGFIAQ